MKIYVWPIIRSGANNGLGMVWMLRVFVVKEWVDMNRNVNSRTKA